MGDVNNAILEGVIQSFGNNLVGRLDFLLLKNLVLEEVTGVEHVGDIVLTVIVDCRSGILVLDCNKLRLGTVNFDTIDSRR